MARVPGWSVRPAVCLPAVRRFASSRHSGRRRRRLIRSFVRPSFISPSRRCLGSLQNLIIGMVVGGPSLVVRPVPFAVMHQFRPRVELTDPRGRLTPTFVTHPRFIALEPFRGGLRVGWGGHRRVLIRQCFVCNLIRCDHHLINYDETTANDDDANRFVIRKRLCGDKMAVGG